MLCLKSEKGQFSICVYKYGKSLFVSNSKLQKIHSDLMLILDSLRSVLFFANLQVC